MEFPNVGRQCDRGDCKQLDFLPLMCKCGLKFCPEHFKIHIESCETTPSNTVVELTKITDVYKCSQSNCKKTSIVQFVCDNCKKNFCIEHRHTIECTVDPVKAEEFKKKNIEVYRQFEKAKLLVNQEIDENIARAKSKGKNTQKVQLMRLKGKAVGLKSIPATDRIYFNIIHPKSLDVKTTAVFVSRNWSIGKAIDAISEELRIPNRNNQVNALKLRLFKVGNGQLVSNIMADKMDNILKENIIVDGEELLIEYVPDSCVNFNNL